ncbi:MAG: tetratricopeptide repeat protein [Bacteroidales bacterium]
MKSKITIISLWIISLILLGSCSVLKKSAENEEDDHVKTEKEFMYDAHFLEALHQKTLEKYEEALTELEKAKTYIEDEAVLYFQLAEVNSKLGYFSKAQEYAEKSVELEPDNIWYHILLTRLYQNAGLFADATEQMSRILELEPGKMEYYFMLSSLHQSIGNPKDALTVMDEAEDYFGITDIISIEKQSLYQSMDKPGKAIREIEKLTNAFPDEPKYEALLAELYVTEGETEKAKEIYDELEQADHLDGNILLSISEFYYQNNHYDKAYNYLKKAFASEDMNIDMKIEMLASMLMNTGSSDFEKEQESELFEILIHTHPDNPKAMTVYSDYLVKAGEFEEAMEVIQKVLSTTRDKYMIWEQALYLANQSNDYETMYQYCDTITGLFPNQPLPYLYGSVASFQLEKNEETIEYAKQGLKYTFDNKPVKVELLTFLGEAYHKKEAHHKADSAFDEVLKLDPDNVFVLNNYAYYLSLRKEKLEKAKSMGKKLIKQVPTNPSYLDTYAWVLYELGEYEEALEKLREAYELGGKERAVIVEHYGDALYKNGETEEAVKKWKEALSMDEDNEKLKQKIESKGLND